MFSYCVLKEVVFMDRKYDFEIGIDLHKRFSQIAVVDSVAVARKLARSIEANPGRSVRIRRDRINTMIFKISS